MSDGLPGPLIGTGRSADIYDIGGGRVLRRSRRADVSAPEVAAMRAVAAAGYPVPVVYSIDGRDMVLDRVVGRDMRDALAVRPWRAGRYGTLLGDLHLALRNVDLDRIDGDDGIDGIDGLQVFDPPEAIVHGDLHPGNVLLADDRPVVIDWEGARIGPADADTALAWLLTEVAELENIPLLVRPIARFVRRRFVRALLERAGRPRPATVDLVCGWRADDPNMSTAELGRISAFAGTNGTTGGSGDV